MSAQLLNENEVVRTVAHTKDASGNKTIYPHVVMRSAAKWALTLAKKCEEGSYYQSLLSCLSMAFAIEAYFNYLGEKIVPNWHSEHEKQDHKDKIKFLAKTAGYELSYQSPEYEAFTRVFNLRKSLVHGKVEAVTGSWSTELKGKTPSLALETEWEKLADPETANEIYDRCVGLITALHSASGLPGAPFAIQMHGLARIQLEADDDTAT